MNSVNTEERRNGDAMLIASGLGVSKRYVNNLLSGERNTNTKKARAIVRANNELQKMHMRLEMKFNKIKQELIDQE